MGRRTILLIAALLVAALGTVLVFLYANNAREAAQAGQQLVKVVVATKDIPAGTTGADASAQGSFEEREIPADTAVPGALSSVTPIAQLVALSPIYTGQQIILPQWGSADQVSGLGLPEGKIALSLALGDPERVAGFVNPGSTVAIFATGGESVRLLLSDILVLGVGASTVNAQPTGQAGNTENVSTAILTLALTQREAEQIIAAQGRISPAEYSGLYFALMDDTSDLEVGGPGVSQENLFGNGN